jgi:DNA-binding CsgD family transcriptional regulator
MQPNLVMKAIAFAGPALKLKLEAGTYVIGRSSDCSFVINHISVSRRHAELSLCDGIIAVADLKSRNGTYIDGTRVETATIECGQRLRFGQVSFVIKDESAGAESDVGTDLSGKGRLCESFDVEFSPAQKRVLDMVLKGHSEKEIGRRLHLSRHTVHNHLQAIYSLAGVHSRAELLARLLRGGVAGAPGH